MISAGYFMRGLKPRTSDSSNNSLGMIVSPKAVLPVGIQPTLTARPAVHYLTIKASSNADCICAASVFVFSSTLFKTALPFPKSVEDKLL